MKIGHVVSLPTFRTRLRTRGCTALVVSGWIVLLALLVFADSLSAQDAPGFTPPPAQQKSAAPIERQTPQTGPQPEQGAPAAVTPVSHYDKAIFLNPFPADQLALFKQFDGMPTSNLMHDKQFRKLLKSIEPNCMFHYGRDMPLDDAIDMVMKDSRVPVQVRDGRYLLASGSNGPYLAGRGFIWIDLQDGIGLGGFSFHPVNGEPTPTLAVFSRQVKEEVLAISDLPPAFADDMAMWENMARVPEVSTRYFLTGSNKRVLLEHDEDYCAPTNGTLAPPGDACQQMNADAADDDLTAAYYLDQVRYATNATAWMIGPEQTAFLQIREHTCGGIIDPLPCRIRVTRERVHVVMHRPPPHMGGGHPHR